ncbi:glycosyltransferase family 2 protein [Acaryochloris sp. IP29b_bin.137]|uniref:glycosyltransferase family 2 protein n=1 Tax=Acaryochloris sp. IP29b_bin.137 TaxID=2969217 RepID=UPI002615A3F9|nr:glycosyltransferase family 2 protein [Acaryochloris sp. IP29b_bin.137]
MKVSIITVSYNSADTIQDTIKTIYMQTYTNFEHIIIDNNSDDDTAKIVKPFLNQKSIFISEPDQGIYDAMNKGIRLAKGDIIGILNADDIYANKDVILDIIETFEKEKVDCVFGDLVYVRPNNLNQIVRYYRSANFHPKLFAYGWMPAHPTVFIKRQAYERYGLFQIDYKIAADYELMIRFLAKHKISYKYIPKVMVKMRTGGVSTLNWKSNWILNQEIIRGCAENDIDTTILKVWSKYFTKVFQLIRRPK